MNRREKRRLQKQMGLHKKSKDLSITQKLQRIERGVKENAVNKEKSKEDRERQKNKIRDEKMSAEISSRATTISVTQGVKWYQAMEMAKEEVEKEWASK